jgi:hypothetical protein
MGEKVEVGPEVTFLALRELVTKTRCESAPSPPKNPLENPLDPGRIARADASLYTRSSDRCASNSLDTGSRMIGRHDLTRRLFVRIVLAWPKASFPITM